MGVLSERALESLIESQARFNFSSNWNFAISPLEENKEGGWAVGEWACWERAE